MLMSLDGRAILSEYRSRWTVENAIKDLVANYFFDNVPGIDPHRTKIHYFVVTLARTLYETLSRDCREARNPDGSKKTIRALRSEFPVGANAILSRKRDELVLTWKDACPEKRHQPLTALLDKLNQSKFRRLRFLGGLRIRFEIVPPRSQMLRSQFRRQPLEIRSPTNYNTPSMWAPACLEWRLSDTGSSGDHLRQRLANPRSCRR